MATLSPETIANAVVLVLIGLAGLGGRLTVKGRARAREMSRLRVLADEAEAYAFLCRSRLRANGIEPDPLPASLQRLANEPDPPVQEGTS